jgi:hypothetical protein
VIPDFNIFHGHNANEPSGEKVAWVLQHMRDSGRCPDTSSLNFALGRRVFRSDIFEKALRLATQQSHDNEKPTKSQPTPV